MDFSWAHAYPIRFLLPILGDCADALGQTSWEQPWAPRDFLKVVTLTFKASRWYCRYLRLLPQRSNTWKLHTFDISSEISQEPLRHTAGIYGQGLFLPYCIQLCNGSQAWCSQISVWHSYVLFHKIREWTSICAAPSVIVRLWFCPHATLADSFEF